MHNPILEKLPDAKVFIFDKDPKEIVIDEFIGQSIPICLYEIAHDTAKETNEIENISLKSPTSTLIFSATHRKDQDVIDWLGDTWPYDQNLLKRARYRFLNTGIAFQVFTFAGTEKKLNSN